MQCVTFLVHARKDKAFHALLAANAADELLQARFRPPPLSAAATPACLSAITSIPMRKAMNNCTCAALRRCGRHGERCRQYWR
jgi:hypothetical protein